MRRLAVVAIALPFLGCAPRGEEEPVTAGPDVQAVRDWFGRYTAAINAGELDPWAELVAADAVILPPDEPPIIGIAEIRPRYAAVFGAYSFQFEGGIQEITVAGRLAVVRASIEETLTPKDGSPATEFRGAWLMVLREQSDGSWKLWRNMWSVFPPPASGT